MTPGEAPSKPVERLFPFVLRARILIVGRDLLRHRKSKLHFVLITHDVSENSRAEILADFLHYPIVQRYTQEDLEKFFQIRGAKVIGFEKSGLAQSIYAELKPYRINQPFKPPVKPPAEADPAASPIPRREKILRATALAEQSSKPKNDRLHDGLSSDPASPDATRP